MVNTAGAGRTRLAAVAGVLALAAGGATAMLPGDADAGKRTPRTRTVTVGTTFYSPSKLTIRRGDRVRFKWEGGFERHNVGRPRAPEKFRSPTQASGTYTRTFRRAGTYKLVCTLHDMDMKLVVKR